MDLHEHLQSTLGTRYSITRELAGGGMSRVFVATETSLGRQVVLKVLPPELAGGLNVDRFRREIQLAARLLHPHIVPLLSADESGGVPYYTMPFVAGESLRSRLQRLGRLPIDEAIELTKHIASALDYAHRHGIIHRDIKPENVLLHDGNALVTDFGIARALGQATAGLTLTQAGVVLGTPAYMSPEQALGEREVDARADIYSLGCVLYEMLTGAPPFKGATAQAVFARHMTEPVPTPSVSRREVPTGIDGIVTRALAKDSQERFATAAQFVSELVRASAPRVAAVSTPMPLKPAIAVLPLANLSQSADDEYFSDGMTEDIIAQLSKVASLRVISRTSVMRFKKTDVGTRAIASELGVSYIVEGSVRRAQNRLRIVAQLIDARTDEHLWAETYDRDLTDVFAIQTEVAERITTSLKATLTPSERNRIAKRPTDDLRAYELFLLGRQSYYAPPTEKVPFSTAAGYFQQAIDRDPAFAKAYAWLAYIHTYYGQGYWGTNPRDAWPRGHALASRALALDPDAAEAHATLGTHAAAFRFDWDDALQAHDRAIAIDPNNVLVCASHVYVLSMCGRTDDAVLAAERAYELDPVAATTQFKGFVNWVGRRFHESLAAHESLTRLAPDLFFVKVWHALVLVGAGREEEALSLVAPYADTYSDDWSTLIITSVLAAAGEHALGRSRLAELHAREVNGYIWPTGFAIAYGYLGDLDRAFEYLERAYHDRAGWIPILATAPCFDPLRGDPRFDDLVKRVGSPATPYRPPKRAVPTKSPF